MNDTIGGDGDPDATTAVTTIPISPRTYTLLLIAALAAIVLLFVWSQSVLPLLLGSATLALVLSWPVRLLARVMPRGMAIFIVVVGLLLVAVVALVALIPAAIRELADLIVASPQPVTDAERGLRRLLQRAAYCRARGRDRQR